MKTVFDRLWKIHEDLGEELGMTLSYAKAVAAEAARAEVFKIYGDAVRANQVAQAVAEALSGV